LYREHPASTFGAALRAWESHGKPSDLSLVYASRVGGCSVLHQLGSSDRVPETAPLGIALWGLMFLGSLASCVLFGVFGVGGDLVLFALLAIVAALGLLSEWGPNPQMIRVGNADDAGRLGLDLSLFASEIPRLDNRFLGPAIILSICAFTLWFFSQAPPTPDVVTPLAPIATAATAPLADEEAIVRAPPPPPERTLNEIVSDFRPSDVSPRFAWLSGGHNNVQVHCDDHALTAAGRALIRFRHADYPDCRGLECRWLAPDGTRATAAGTPRPGHRRTDPRRLLALS